MSQVTVQDIPLSWAWGKGQQTHILSFPIIYRYRNRNKNTSYKIIYNNFQRKKFCQPIKLIVLNCFRSSFIIFIHYITIIINIVIVTDVIIIFVISSIPWNNWLKNFVNKNSLLVGWLV